VESGEYKNQGHGEQRTESQIIMRVNTPLHAKKDTLFDKHHLSPELQQGMILE